MCNGQRRPISYSGRNHGIKKIEISEPRSPSDAKNPAAYASRLTLLDAGESFHCAVRRDSDLDEFSVLG